MVLNQLGQTCLFSGGKQLFYVGQEVIANHCSSYAGLPGVITEIRDGEDKETDNPEADIYCTFKIPTPENPYFTEALELRFGCSYPDIPLDRIIMASNMLEPKTSYQMNARISEMLILSYYLDTCNKEDDYILCISDDRDILRGIFKAHKENNPDITDGLVEEIDENGSVDRYSYTDGDDYFCYSIFPVETIFKENWSVILNA